MKDLLTKKHYCCKVRTSLMKSSAYPLSLDNSLYGLPPPTPPPHTHTHTHTYTHFYKKNLIPSFYDFSKIPPLRTVDKGGSHYAVIHQYLISYDCLLMVQILSL